MMILVCKSIGQFRDWRVIHIIVFPSHCKTFSTFEFVYIGVNAHFFFIDCGGGSVVDAGVDVSSNVSLLAQSSFELGNATFSRRAVVVGVVTLVLVSLTVDELENVRSFSDVWKSECISKKHLLDRLFVLLVPSSARGIS